MNNKEDKILQLIKVLESIRGASVTEARCIGTVGPILEVCFDNGVTMRGRIWEVAVDDELDAFSEDPVSTTSARKVLAVSRLRGTMNYWSLNSFMQIAVGLTSDAGFRLNTRPDMPPAEHLWQIITPELLITFTADRNIEVEAV